MATITNSSKYGEGHQVILKKTTFLSNQLIEKLKKYGYYPGKSVFTITKQVPKTYENIAITAGNEIGRAHV